MEFQIWRRTLCFSLVVVSAGALVLRSSCLLGKTSSPRNHIFTAHTRQALCNIESITGKSVPFDLTGDPVRSSLTLNLDYSRCSGPLRIMRRI